MEYKTMTPNLAHERNCTDDFPYIVRCLVLLIVFTILNFYLPEAIAQADIEINFEREFKTSGSETGLFDEPRAVAVDSRDRIVVTDSDRGSSADTNVHICDGWGNCRGFGERGSDIGQFSRAFGVAIDSRDRIIISDYDNNRIQICSDKGECTAFGGSSNATLMSAGGSQKVLADAGKFDGPNGVAIDSTDHIVIADSNNHRIQICDDEGNCTVLGSQGSGLGEFQAPRSLTVDNQDRIIVADSGNHRIQICSQQGICSSFGEQGVAPGQFNWPWDVAVDSQDRIMVTEEQGNRIQVCSYQGECLAFGMEGSAPGQFDSPRGIAVDSRDRIIVADLFNNRVQIFRTRDPIRINPGLNDAWYYPDTSGQGFFITVFPDIAYVSLAWFTYDTELPAEEANASLGDPGHRWLTAVGPITGNQAILQIEMTSGGIFDTSTEIQRTDPPGSDGSITLTFDNCNSGIVEYDITSINRQGIVPISRVAKDNAELCKVISSE